MSDRKEKKAQFAQAGNRKKSPIYIVAAIIFVAVAAGAFLFMGPSAPAMSYVKADAGKVVIPLAEVSDGQAHYYKYKAGDQDVNFFLLKSRDGAVRAALDACDVCYKSLKGYRQEGDYMVCNNCNMKFESHMINVVKGGCNPAPLTRSVNNGQIVLNERELLDGRRYFPNKS